MPLAPLFWSGGIRAATGLEPGPSLLLAILLVALASVLLLSPLRPRFRPREALGWALVAATFGLAANWLYNPFFDGMVSVGGGDNGVHVREMMTWLRSDPTTYGGCVGMHALAWWLERALGWTAFESFRVIFYLTVLWVVSLPCLAVLGSSNESSSAGLAVTAAAWLALTLWSAARYLLPVLGYQQADGFMAHLFALVPLIAAWLVDVLVRARLLRVAGLLLSLAAYRYSYALNLGDFVIAISVLLLVESGGFGRWRWPLRAAALLLGLSSVIVYQYLLQLLPRAGAIVYYDKPTVVQAQWTALAALAAATVAGLLVDGRESALARLARLPRGFCAGGGVAWYVIGGLPGVERYYPTKYSLHAFVLAAVASVAVLSVSLGRAVTALQRRARPARLLAAAAVVSLLVLSAVDGWARGFEPYRPAYLERSTGRPPFRRIRPLADRHARRRIAEILAARSARFAGYLVASWPMFNFFNSELGFCDGTFECFQRAQPERAPGSCVFWEGPGEGWNEWYPQPWLRAQLQSDPARECESYSSTWGSTRSLCWRCY